MSTTIEFWTGDKSESVKIATNKGWADVDDWADELANEAYPVLLGFIDHGECHDLDAMINDIDKALTEDEPDDSTVTRTLRGLRAACVNHKDSDSVIVSDGFESGYGVIDEDDE